MAQEPSKPVANGHSTHIASKTTTATKRPRPTPLSPKLARKPFSYTQWLLNNQISIASTALAGLLFARVFFPDTNPCTSKLWSLSYRNERTGKYGVGFEDLWFVGFVVFALTGARAALMEYALAPLGKRLGASSPKLANRFAEQGWMLAYYSVFWPLGMYIYCGSSYYLNMAELWTDWPQREIGGLIKWYTLCQWAFWIHQVLVINIETRRKDHWQMLSHHLVTIVLITASYAYHQTRVGNVIMITMDVVDLVFPLAKCLKYLGYTTICDILFGVFVAVWLGSRHILFPLTCWSVYKDLPRITEPGCYNGPLTDLSGPAPIPSGWSHLIDPFVNPGNGTVCWNDNIMYVFLTYLVTLQVMMFVWSVFIIRVVIGVLKGAGAEDIRSDEEDEEEVELELEGDVPQTVSLETKFASRATASPRPMSPISPVSPSENWKRMSGSQQRRPGSSTGVSITRPSTAKDLLDRIGCEKKMR